MSTVVAPIRSRDLSRLPTHQRDVEERKPAECDKNQEIEKIKRQLHNLIDRVEALKTK